MKKLFEYPKTIGRHKDQEVIVNKGKFGLYVKYNGKNYPLKDIEVNLKNIIKVIEEKNKDVINEFTINKKTYQIREGKYGPYISYSIGKKIKFISIPKNKDVNKINENDVKKLISKT